MLTEEEMDKIKSEEIYRDEIRKKLNENDDKSFGTKSWKFINSSFGIWLLSTVVVGLIVYFYNDNKLKNEIAANNAASIQKLETEISNRLQQFKLALSNQEPSKIYYQKEELAYMVDGVLISDGTLAQKKPIYIFPEYKERTMNSLLYEIGRLTKDKEQISTITEARTILGRIKSTILKMEDPPRPDFGLSQLLNQKIQVQPENLTEEEKKLWTEYQEKEKSFEKGPLSEYNNRIKKSLDELRQLFESNPFLKEMWNGPVETDT